MITFRLARAGVVALCSGNEERVEITTRGAFVCSAGGGSGERWGGQRKLSGEGKYTLHLEKSDHINLSVKIS